MKHRFLFLSDVLDILKSAWNGVSFLRDLAEDGEVDLESIPPEEIGAINNELSKDLKPH